MWTLALKVDRYVDSHHKRLNDQLILEKNIHIIINKTESYSFTFTPNLEDELICGFLYCKEYITHVSQFTKHIDQNNDIHITIATKNSLPQSKIEPQQISMASLYQLTSYIQEKAILYKATAITESASLCINNELSYFAEDTSVMNAYYKVIGLALLDNASFNTGLMIVSSKIDSPMIETTSYLGIPTLASRTAPTYLAYQKAEENNITLIGFARGKKCNVYTNKQFVRV